jgi:hypothetical protein
MSDAGKPKIEDLGDEAALWKAYRDPRRVKGFDVARFYLDLAEEEKKGLHPVRGKISPNSAKMDVSQ